MEKICYVVFDGLPLCDSVMMLAHPTLNVDFDADAYLIFVFYTGRIFKNQILHPKKRLKAPKTLKMSLKKSNICIFLT